MDIGGVLPGIMRNRAQSGSTLSSIPPREGRLDAIQHLRAIASISVVLFHASHILHLKGVEGGLSSTFGWHFGRFGVVMFFTISGFLMARIMVNAAPTLFLFQRIARIYPTYWMVAILVLLAHMAGGEDLMFDIRALLLLPGGAWQYLLGVEWTLPYELVFYALISALIWIGARQHVTLVASLWIVLIIVAQRYWPEVQNAWQFPSVFQLPWIDFSAAFACGLLIPFLLRSAVFRMTCGLLGLVSLALSEYVAPYSMAFLIAGCSLLTGAAASSRFWNGMNLSILRQLGDWSFAIYLCHVPVILLFSGIFLSHLSPIPLWLGCIVAAMLVGSAVGILDVKIHRSISRSSKTLPNRMLVFLNCAFLLSLLCSMVL